MSASYFFVSRSKSRSHAYGIIYTPLGSGGSSLLNLGDTAPARACGD